MNRKDIDDLRCDSVKICGQIIVRPNYVSVTAWLLFWENAAFPIRCEKCGYWWSKT
jgi:ribosomal protein S27E